jgi:hypothetical protein
MAYCNFQTHIRNRELKKEFQATVRDCSKRHSAGQTNLLLLRINSDVVWNTTSEVLYFSTSSCNSPDRDVETSGGCVSSETCTELATTLTILVPSPTPQCNNLTVKLLRGEILKMENRCKFFMAFNKKFPRSVIIKVGPYHIDKYLA